jgi:hypothetical protein
MELSADGAGYPVTGRFEGRGFVTRARFALQQETDRACHDE